MNELDVTIAAAMKARDQTRLSTLRMLKAAIVNRSIERGRELRDEEVRQVVASLIKQRREAIDQFVRGGRQELADREAAEIGVLEQYLPPAVASDELEAAVAGAIAETGATGPKDVGRVMKAALARLAGRTVDGRAVNELVRQKLSR